MKLFDSAIYYGMKARLIDNSNGEAYSLLAEMYFLKSDTVEALRYFKEGVDHGLKPEEASGFKFYKIIDDPRFKSLLHESKGND